MPEPTQYPLQVRTSDHNPDAPFSGDLFQRKDLANRLTGLIERMNDGTVIAIDAPWGAGKTWFAKNWQSQLKTDGYGAVLVDAFKHDYVEDPFLILCSEVLSEIEDGEVKEKISEAGRKVAKALLPIAAKAIINMGGRLLLGNGNISEEFAQRVEEINDSLADAAKGHISKRLDEFDAERKSVEGFAAILKEYAASRQKPLIILIDELDRCRPDFCIKTIERAKHFFDVPKIIFVLLVNRPQIERYIRVAYGTEVDASNYLGKFILFWINLPKVLSIETQSQDHNQIYCRELEQRFGFDRNQGHYAFRETFATLATAMNFSLRELERGYTLFSLGQPINSASVFAAWPIILKLRYPDIFVGIVAGEKQAHLKAKDIIHKLPDRINNNFMLEIMSDLHQCHIDMFSIQPTQNTQEALREWRFRYDQYIPWLFGRIDFAIAN
jgi:hypothetical protein